MAVEIITNWDTLMQLAQEVGQAKLSGDKERLKKAQEAHDNYRDTCLKSDKMSLNCRNGDL